MTQQKFDLRGHKGSDDGNVKVALHDFFNQTITEIEKAENAKAEDALRTLQDKFKCCEVYGPDDRKEPTKRCCKTEETSCGGYLS
ncbi:hypothetical protein ACTXT7_016016 [Hymenolepis weldensis]